MATGTDEDDVKDNYCYHEVMMMKRKRRKTTRMDNGKDHCDEVMMYIVNPAMRTTTSPNDFCYVDTTTDDTDDDTDDDN